MSEEQKEYQVIDKRMPEPESETTAVSVVQLAIQRNLSPEMIEKLMDLQERHQANEAKKAYTEAMALFKADPPDIYKDKINKQFNSKYSSIDAIVNPAIPYLSKYGLSHRWDYPKSEGNMVVVSCILTHKMGHSESVTMSAPPDTSGGNSKNPIQQIKSTQTYLKIATFEAVTGLVSREANLDDDGNNAGGEPEYITLEQGIVINNMIKESGADEAKFLAFIGAEMVDMILAQDYTKAFNMLKAKMKTKDKK